MLLILNMIINTIAKYDLINKIYLTCNILG